jgi:hypothetical protein
MKNESLWVWLPSGAATGRAQGGGLVVKARYSLISRMFYLDI